MKQFTFLASLFSCQSNLGRKSGFYRIFCLLLLLCSFTVNMQSQTKKIIRAYYKGNDVSTIVNSADPDEKQVYLYNVGTKEFLLPGSHWGMRAVLGETGMAFDVVKDMTLPSKADAYRFRARGLLTEGGSSLAWAGEAYGAVYLDRTNPVQPGIGDKPRVVLIPVSTSDPLAKAYYVHVYQTGSFTVSASKDTTWAYSNEKYLYANSGMEEGGRGIRYYNSLEEAKSSKDSVAIWKLVTLKDLKKAIKETYAYNEEPSNITFSIKDPWLIRTKKRAEMWKIVPANLLTNEFEKGYSGLSKYGPYFHGEAWGKSGSVTQTFTVKHPGWYLLTCSGFYRRSVGSDMTAYLFAQDDNKQSLERAKQRTPLYVLSDANLTKYSSADGDSYLQAGQALTAGKYARNSVMIYVYGNGQPNFSTQLTIGIKIEGANVKPSDWVSFDNFMLQYCGINTIVLDEDETAPAYMQKQIDPNLSTTLQMQRSFISGQWNSVMLPCDLTGKQVELAFGADAKVSKFKGPSSTRKTLMEFESVQLDEDNRNKVVIEAGKLYLIKPMKELAKAENEFSVGVYLPHEKNLEMKFKGTYFTVPGVTLKTAPSKSTIEEPYKTSALDNNSLRFRGTYVNQTAKVIPAGSYVMNKDGKWYRTSKPHSAKGFRCWVESGNSSGAGAKLLSISIDGQIVDEVLGGGTTNIDNAIRENEMENADKVYSLDGRLVRSGKASLDGLPKGIYIIGKKKYVIQ